MESNEFPFMLDGKKYKADRTFDGSVAAFRVTNGNAERAVMEQVDGIDSRGIGPMSLTWSLEPGMVIIIARKVP